MITVIRKHPVITFTVTVIIALLVYGFWPQAILVEAVKVNRAPMSITVEEEGRTRVIDRYVIAAPVSGVTCRVGLNVGDVVTQGQTLLTITPLESEVLDPRSRAQAQARLAAAKSALQAAIEEANAAAEANKLAILELNRYEPLLNKGTISRDQYDRALNDANTSAAYKRSADFNVEVSRYELEAAQAVLEQGAVEQKDDTVEHVLVRSPINGRILKINRQCEGPVNVGEALLEVGDPTALEIEVDVLSADAVKIKPGMPVSFDRWGGAQPLLGKVRTVEPVGFTKVSALGVEEQRVLIISDFTSPIEHWRQLGDGYRVEASFIIWHEENVLQIPASSLFRHNKQWAVYKIENNVARLQTVQIGKHNGLSAQVLEGLTAGDRLIDHPDNKVEDSKRIQIR